MKPTRRQLLRSLGLAAAAVPFSRLLAACGSDALGEAPDAGGPDAGTPASPDAASAGPDAGTAAAWATGGTAVMSGDYADPFASGIGSTCTLTCSATLGPCYAQTLTRKDISEGQDGLPVRLAFLIVDEGCNPIPDATIDIWHTSPTGLYSGSDASTFCTLGNAEAVAARWFRGVQATDADGRADFDTCFPGWYSGRTIHIHFTIRVGGTEYVTSQLFFDDALEDEIIGGQPIYKDRGARDTTNQNDSVVSASAVGDYLFQTARQADGAMLAWKTIVIRNATSESLCTIPGGTMGPPG
jgi:protocatechuate 3,4-dioxygenase beta subunit